MKHRPISVDMVDICYLAHFVARYHGYGKVGLLVMNI